jgi:hypothetical protein
VAAGTHPAGGTHGELHGKGLCVHTLDKTTGCSGDLLVPLRKHLCFPSKIENDLKRALWQDGIMRSAGAGRFPDPGNVVL